jgi:hypothetical protein
MAHGRDHAATLVDRPRERLERCIGRKVPHCSVSAREEHRVVAGRIGCPDRGGRLGARHQRRVGEECVVDRVLRIEPVHRRQPALRREEVDLVSRVAKHVEGMGRLGEIEAGRLAGAAQRAVVRQDDRDSPGRRGRGRCLAGGLGRGAAGGGNRKQRDRERAEKGRRCSTGACWSHPRSRVPHRP